MGKRISCRAIIFKNDALVIMHRIRPDKEYYTFPGGGLEDDDKNYEECIKREIIEEFGINVKPIKLVYEYHTNDSIQYFYLCEWVDGIFGSGKGPEMINYIEKNGHYIPTLQNLYDLNAIVLEPKVITNQLLQDIKEYDLALSNEIKMFEEQKNIS